MKRYEVEKIFGGIVCPHCNEIVQINDENDDPMEEFTVFRTRYIGTPVECERFDTAMNEQLQALSSGRASEQEVLDWVAQYKPQSA